MASTFNAIIVAGCLFLFASVNLVNLLRHRTRHRITTERPEIEKRIAAPLLLVGVGTIAFFIESFLYILLGFSISVITLMPPVGLGALSIVLFESLGLLVMVSGYAIFIWSVAARGQYAVSWQMSANHKLVNWGPYRYVRHPSYSGYFLMFIGFLLMWHEAFALVPLIAIPGYIMITCTEEEMLVAKFGEKYIEYEKRVGRFLPKIQMHKLES
jgi:protein-S-isoprenylcysteine O-methyltransferase Ste14